MLETRFPRVYGDAGNASTWPFAVEIEVVRGASPASVVRHGASGLVDAFIEAGQRLAALLQVPMVSRLLPSSQRVGILTVDSTSLGRDHLLAVGADPSTPIMGTEGGTTFTRAMLGNLRTLDASAALDDLLAAGHRLLAVHRDVGAIVLECANMPPYAAALSAALAVPVYDWHSMVSWFALGLCPRAFYSIASNPSRDAAIPAVLR